MSGSVALHWFLFTPSSFRARLFGSGLGSSASRSLSYYRHVFECFAKSNLASYYMASFIPVKNPSETSMYYYNLYWGETLSRVRVPNARCLTIKVVSCAWQATVKSERTSTHSCMCDSPWFLPAPIKSKDGASKTPFLKYDDSLMATAEWNQLSSLWFMNCLVPSRVPGCLWVFSRNSSLNQSIRKTV